MNLDTTLFKTDIFLSQITEYHQCFNIRTSTTQTSTPANFDTSTIEAPLLDMIDQEFEDYTKAVSFKETDMIKFWNVSNFFAIFTIKCSLQNLV